MKKIVAPISWTKHLLPMHPIVYITTVSIDGLDNGAVFATCLDTSYNPPQLTFASAIRQHKVAGTNGLPGGIQDTFRNIEDTGMFVVNVPGIEIAWAMKELACPYGYGVDEIAKAGLTKLPPFSFNRAPFPKVIGECLAHLECQLAPNGIYHVNGSDHYLITGNVTVASYDESLGDTLSDTRANLATRVFGQLGASENPSARYIGLIQVQELKDTLVFEAEK